MAEGHKERLPHILVRDTAVTSPYTSRRGGGGKQLKLPSRDRAQHAAYLIQQIEQLREREASAVKDQKAFGLDSGSGIYLAFESEPGFDLKFTSLEFERSGIELCSVKQLGEQIIATVFVPEGKLKHFLRKISQYRDELTSSRSPEKPGKPKHRDLIEGISDIKLAALQQLWTDGDDVFPKRNESVWWEVWLRQSDDVDYEALVRQHAPELEMRVSDEAIHFLDRTILLLYGTKAQMARSIHLLGAISEVRSAKETAAFFTGLKPTEQKEWIDSALARMSALPRGAPSVCLLDTGLNEQHPLLKPVAEPADMHSYNKGNWGTDDRYGHGTPMAGLAAYGDLAEPLAHDGPITLTHRLESVKIMTEPGSNKDRHLYGAITRESISRVEIDPNRKRIFCMAVTTPDDRDRGRPSSWSATIDALASGYDDDQHRLIVLSAGNTAQDQRHRFPDSSLTDEVHDPGQAWNALTVGGYTEKVQLDTAQYPGWRVVAPAGDLAPCSCTSMQWARNWPFKPEIVMEAGNMAISPVDGSADYIDDNLQLLSTAHDFALGKQVISFGDTSAAAALASRLAAMAQGQYPEYWPETIRALIVHSARWTEAMKTRFAPLRTQDQFRQLLRYCGYGVPDRDELLWSTHSALTLIAQDSLQPFAKDGSRVKTRDINIHSLPWPAEALRAIPENTQVEMKVTLSYFVEPNPGQRGWVNKYRYASHGLRFDVRRPLENLEAFRQRINRQARDEEAGPARQSVGESGKWALGEKLRSLGSIHSDTWYGTAAELAARGYIAIYPVLGWWKERANLQRWGKSARYALVVSIKTPGVETDIYTPVVNQIAAQVLV